MRTPNTFPLKRRGTEGAKERLKKKKEKEERRRGRARGANLEKKKKKRERCHPVDSNAEAEPWTPADRERSKPAGNGTRRRGFGRAAAAFSELPQIKTPGRLLTMISSFRPRPALLPPVHNYLYFACNSPGSVPGDTSRCILNRIKHDAGHRRRVFPTLFAEPLDYKHLATAVHRC